jgi:protein-disulfide isomerase
MTIRWNALLSTLLVICAITTTLMVVRRELFEPNVRFRAQRPTLVTDWPLALDKYERVGPANARVKLIEFEDFECPFCGEFYKTLRAVEKRYPTDVSLTFVYFPIPGHRFAIPAARVAECAADQGHFEAMHDRLFDGQDSLGLKPWRDYATAADVPDLAAFDVCTKKTDPIPRVEAGKELGKNLDVQGTPTLIINGWKLARPPTESELDSMIKAVLAGKSPVSART